METLSIIIPVYNELNTIQKIIEKILNNKKYNYEIIVIDDYSTDGTRKVLENKLRDKIDHLILNNDNYGKGYSIRQGIKRASGDIIIIQDADLEYDPSDYEKLINPILYYNADVVFGSRFSGDGSRRVLFFWHTIGNKLLTFFSNMLTNINLTDMECGYKVFKSHVIKNLELRENRFGIEPEITAKVSKKKFILFEVGVSYNGRDYAEGKKITWKDGFSAIKCIIKYNLF